MRMRQNQKQLPIASTLLPLSLMLLFSLSIVLPLFKSLECPVNLGRIFLVHTALLLLWALILQNRRSRMLTLLTVEILIAACALWLVITGHFHVWLTAEIHSLQQYFTWLWLYILGDRRPTDANISSMMLGISALVTLPTAFFTVTKPNWLAPAVIGVACTGTLAVLGHPPYWPGIIGYLLSCVCYGALSAYRKAGAQHSLRMPPDSAILLSVLPLAALAVLIGVVLANRLPVLPGNAYDLRVKLQEDTQMADLAKNKPVGAVFGGGTLGGNIALNDTNILDVEAPEGGFYLRGTSWDRYTGSGWEHSVTDMRDMPNEVQMPDDTEETLAMAPLLAGDEIVVQKAFTHMTAQITYRAFASNYLYAPLKTEKILNADTDTGSLQIDLDGTFMAGPVSGTNYQYTAQFYKPTTDDPAFGEMVRKSYPGWSRDYIAHMRPGAQQQELQRIEENSEQATQKYLQLPDELPERIRDLALQITQGETNTYDKASAVEGYLRSHYRYTESPGSRVDGVDFVDEFLFEKKQGYCTYFATSMAVMMRTLGIPARYVEGYILPAAENDGTTYHVTNKQCHTWVEVYFDGLGWLTFDPTGNTVAVQTLPSPTATEVPFHTSSPTSSPEISFSPTLTPTATPSLETGSSAAEKPSSSALPAWVRPFLLALLVLAALAVAYLARIYALRRALAKMPPRVAVQFLYGKCLHILQSLEYRMEEGETPQAFAVRVDQGLEPAQRIWRHVTGIFELARFSEHEITAEQCEILAAFYAQLLEQGRKKLGPIRYLFYRYLY